MPVLEVELKFPVSDEFSAVLERLRELGYTELSERREENSIFDTDQENGRLHEAGVLLRVRKAVSGSPEAAVYTLTVKTRSAEELDRETSSGMKVRREHEIELGGSASDIFGILEGIGFRVVFCYGKVRREFRGEGVSVCLDRLDFGDFVEIEASDEESIRKAARAIGLDPESGTALSYVELGRHAGRDRKRMRE